jgi:ABC-type polysaccharide/polyol phosphate transport system ATPase subunit/acetyltransferase-like isoleucine patch superfamily enzyme
MNNDEAIVVDHLSKEFRIPHDRKVTMYEHIIGLLKGGKYSYEQFQALDDVSFTVRRGETFGVIGPNGSGKSTLLKILAGVLYPDTGSVRVNGKIAPFLELGVGFQPDLTAKENIFLYGSIMGLSKKDIAERYDAILAFAELKRFENMKLKNFSSGMAVRLAFSTAIQTDPDVLLVDEVLAVGDGAFQEKCSQKITEIRQKDKTIIFVSHDLATVEKLCNRCLYIKNGRIAALGKTPEVVQQYLSEMNPSHKSGNQMEIGSEDGYDEVTEGRSEHVCSDSIDDTGVAKESYKEQMSGKEQQSNPYSNLIASNVHIGEYTYGDPQIFMWTNKYHVYIGKFTSIASQVRIIVDGNHNTSWISSYPFGELIPEAPRHPDHPVGKGDIRIGHDVWIGYNSIIMPGVQIGNGAVIGAGSVVTKNVADYEIVAGNPARHIRYRFSPEQIDALNRICWWDWPKEKIIEHASILQSEDIAQFIERFS